MWNELSSMLGQKPPDKTEDSKHLLRTLTYWGFPS